MNLHDEAERGRDAKLLLENRIFTESVSKLKESIVDKWRSCPIRDREGQHELKLMDKVLTDIVGYIKQVADTGKMADIQLEQERKVQELKKAGIR